LFYVSFAGLGLVTAGLDYNTGYPRRVTISIRPIFIACAWPLCGNMTSPLNRKYITYGIAVRGQRRPNSSPSLSLYRCSLVAHPRTTRLPAVLRRRRSPTNGPATVNVSESGFRFSSVAWRKRLHGYRRLSCSSSCFCWGLRRRGCSTRPVLA